jgi:hypothetical protein
MGARRNHDVPIMNRQVSTAINVNPTPNIRDHIVESTREVPFVGAIWEGKIELVFQW